MTLTTTALAVWLLEQVAADEQDAWRVHDHECPYHPGDGGCTCGWPERLKTDCETRRRIAERHQPDRELDNWYWSERSCTECGQRWHRFVPDELPTTIGPEIGCATLRLLALSYSDRPGYRDDWRP